MILIDVNLLLYAHFSGYPEHSKAHAWLDRQINEHISVGLPWSSLLGFVRLGSNRRVLPQPKTVSEAWTQVRMWLSNETVWIPQPTERHVDVLDRLLALPGMNTNLVPDAHLAALAIEHGLTLCSNDGDFARFPGLRWINPLRP